MKCDDPMKCQTPSACRDRCRYHEEPIHPNRIQPPGETTIYERYSELRAQLAGAQARSKSLEQELSATKGEVSRLRDVKYNALKKLDAAQEEAKAYDAVAHKIADCCILEFDTAADFERVVCAEFDKLKAELAKVTELLRDLVEIVRQRGIHTASPSGQKLYHAYVAARAYLAAGKNQA